MAKWKGDVRRGWKGKKKTERWRKGDDVRVRETAERSLRSLSGGVGEGLIAVVKCIFQLTPGSVV